MDKKKARASFQGGRFVAKDESVIKGSFVHMDPGETKPEVRLSLETDAGSNQQEYDSSEIVARTGLLRQTVSPDVDAQVGSGPGSFPISSPFAEDDNDQPSDDVVEAQLVDATAEARQRERDHESIRIQTVREIQENAAQAEVVDEAWEKKKRRSLFALLVCVSVISLVVATVVGVKMADSDGSEAGLTVAQIVQREFDNHDALSDPESPQSQSVDWMTINDTFVTYPLETEEEHIRFRQRYAMCVLSFATDINNWHARAKWLDPISECNWSGLTCDSRGRLIGVSVGKFYEAGLGFY